MKPGAEAEIPIVVKETGSVELELVAVGESMAPVRFSVRSVPGWLSLAPPFLAILLALLRNIPKLFLLPLLI